MPTIRRVRAGDKIRAADMNAVEANIRAKAPPVHGATHGVNAASGQNIELLACIADDTRNIGVGTTAVIPVGRPVAIVSAMAPNSWDYAAESPLVALVVPTADSYASPLLSGTQDSPLIIGIVSRPLFITRIGTSVFQSNIGKITIQGMSKAPLKRSSADATRPIDERHSYARVDLSGWTSGGPGLIAASYLYTMDDADPTKDTKSSGHCRILLDKPGAVLTNEHPAMILLNAGAFSSSGGIPIIATDTLVYSDPAPAYPYQRTPIGTLGHVFSSMADTEVPTIHKRLIVHNDARFQSLDGISLPLDLFDYNGRMSTKYTLI